MRRALVPAVLVAAVLAFTGCSASATDAGSAQGPTSTGPALTGELTIYAAASLGKAFDALAKDFEQQHPGVDVKPIVYDGSSTLATQLVEGAPADVFASADQKNMQKVVDAGLAENPELFASNTLVIATPKGNPGGVKSLSDLSNPKLTVVLCAPAVPCGAASKTLLANESVIVKPASLEQNVTAVLTKVAAGEADAGLVYVTDVYGDDEVQSVVPAGAAQVVNRYPIAALKGSANSAAATAFVDYVLSDKGRSVLSGLGFGAP